MTDLTLLMCALVAVFAFCLCSEIQSLQDEIPELKKRLKKAEADLVKAVEGEKKASDEVSGRFVYFITLFKFTAIHC